MLIYVMSTDVNLCSDVLYPNVFMMCYIVTTHPITYPHIFVLHRLWNTIISTPLSVGTSYYPVTYVCCSECDVVSNERNEPTSCLVQPISAHCCEVMYFWCFGFRGELGFLNCDDICMCVVNKQFELPEFVSESVYVDLQYDEISLTFTAGPVCLCGVSSSVVVLGLFVRLS